jgi:MFS family permease
VAFLVIETRISSPLVPLGLFGNRNVASANTIGVLMAAGLFAYFFFSALYLQQVLGYTPLEVGLAYLPSMVIWGASSLYSDKLVMRLGIKAPLVTGLGLMTLSLVLFARTPVDGNFVVDVLPATLAVGLGAGIGFNPILLAAMSGVAPQEAGLASGVVNTSFMMGGALGLAILASLADSRTTNLVDGGTDALAALNSGYHIAFLVGAVFTVGAAVLAGLLLKPAPAPAHGYEPEPVGEG